MNKTKATTPQTPKDLLCDLKSLVVEAEKMMIESAGEHTDEAMDALRDQFHDAHERFSDLYDGARKQVVSGAKCTDESIRANPYQSLTIAAGVGLLLGLIVSRRCDK